MTALYISLAVLYLLGVVLVLALCKASKRKPRE
jgi:hypothetical protein